MKSIATAFRTFLISQVCLIGVVFISLPINAWAGCAVYTGGDEQPGSRYPDHPSRLGLYFYVGHNSENLFEGRSYCGANAQFKNDSKLEKLQAQIDNTYVTFAGCEGNKTIKNCQRNFNSPSTLSSFLEQNKAAEKCGAGYQNRLKYGRFYYCAGGGMMERTDFIPVMGCAPNTYAATDNCQPCPSGKYAAKGATSISQCVNAKKNEAVWAISRADKNGFVSCPKGANMAGSGNCACKKGTNWSSKRKQCD